MRRLRNLLCIAGAGFSMSSHTAADWWVRSWPSNFEPSRFLFLLRKMFKPSVNLSSRHKTVPYWAFIWRSGFNDHFDLVKPVVFRTECSYVRVFLRDIHGFGFVVISLMFDYYDFLILNHDSSFREVRKGPLNNSDCLLYSGTCSTPKVSLCRCHHIFSFFQTFCLILPIHIDIGSQAVDLRGEIINIIMD